MLSGTLTALIALSPSSQKRADMHNLTSRLSLRLSDHYLRALLSYVLSEGEWRDVLDELAPAPLQERLQMALHFLDDTSLSGYLRRTVEACKAEGALEGILLTGLTPVGLSIIQSWMDRGCGDVQSAALLGALVVPGRIRDERARRWAEAYTGLLDRWKMYHERVQFDIERGDLARKTAKELGAPPPEMHWAQRQVVVRCNYCNKPVSSPESGTYNGQVST
jgi:WD repeat-containing protein mio